jgi:hypothetical protein
MAQPNCRRPLLLIGVLAALAGPVHAQQPPDVVQSDPTANTAMGTEQLAPMLLNEVQQQQRMLTTQAQRLDAQEEQIAVQARQLEVMQLQVARVMELERTVRASLMKSQYENRRADKL